MQYLNSITGVSGQQIPSSMNLHPGQWVREGYGGKVVRKGVYMGTIKRNGEDVVVWDLGQDRPTFRHLMKLHRQFVIESNRKGRTMTNLWGYLTKIFS